MKTGYSTLCLQSIPFREIEKYLSRIPNSVCEILNDGFHLLNAERVQVLKQLGSSYNLEFTMHLPFADLNNAVTNPLLRKAARCIVLSALNHSYELGSTHAVIHSGKSDVLSSIFFPELHLHYSYDFLKEVGKKATDIGIQMVIENNVGDSYHINSVEDMASFLQDEVAQYYKVVLDIGHAFLSHDLDQFVKHLHEDICYVHLHDNLGDGDDHLPLDESRINWRKAVKGLLDDGFSGIFVIENTSWDENIKSLKLFRDFISSIQS